MNQDFIDVECNPSEDAVQAYSANDELCSANPEPCSANDSCSDLTTTYSPDEVAEKLAISIRTVFGYAKKLIEIWSWVPEAEFRHGGRYTAKALEEMTKLKNAKSAGEYAQTVTAQTGKYTPQAGLLAKLEVTNSTNTLAAKPLPELPTFNIKKVDVGAIRNRTKQLGGLNQQLTDTMKALIAAKVDNKVEELDAKIDEVFAEAENFAVTEARKKIYQSVIGSEVEE
jgi:hypothetical protein